MSITKLSEVYWTDRVLFPKYPEPWKDSSRWDEFDFYAGDYGPEVIHTEEWRYLPVVWDMEVLVWQDVVCDTMIKYYRAMYPETFSAESIIPYQGHWYYDAINNGVNPGKLIVPQPYSQISRDKYYLDPQLIYDLNDKTKLHELTSSIPKREILNLESIRDLIDFPFVLKSNSGASWDWVRIIQDRVSLEQALDWFSGEETLIVEEFIDAVENIGIQICVREDWQVEILDAPQQETNEQWEYQWNIVDINQPIDDWASSLALEIWKKAAEKGFFGVWWMDILKSREWKYYFIDPNFRVTGATSVIMLTKKLVAETWKPVLKVWQFKSNAADISDMLSNAQDPHNPLYVLSAFRDQCTGIINGFSVFSSPSQETLHESRTAIESRWFRF